MDWTHRRLASVLIIACFLAFIAACGDDEIDAESAGEQDSQDQNQESEDENQGGDGEDEDCEDDQTYNPITGECVDTGSENQNQHPENEGGACEDVECDEEMHCDPSTGECVECIGDGHCDEGLVCDLGQNECIEEDHIPGACSSDDDCPEEQVCNLEIEQCEDDPGEFECGPGAIVGETCTPDDGVLPYAEVVVEGYNCEGEFFTMETKADGEGQYEFDDVPAGTHELTIGSGSFEVTDEVSVQKNEETDLASVGAKLCFTGAEVNIAVAPGTFDDVGSVLSGMNIEYDTINNNTAFFSDLDQMQQYDIIFAACGTSTMGLGGAGFDADSDEIAYNIRRYVETGHSLYASDLASSFIRYSIPEAIEFSSNYSGSAGQDVTADVVGDTMYALLDRDTVEVAFDTSAAGWHIFKDVGVDSEIQFRGDVDTGGTILEDIPLMMIYDDPLGGGRAIYTSFHNSEQATGDVEDILEFTIFQL